MNRIDFDDNPELRELKDLRVSAHVLIERDGQVVQFVPFDQRAWHAGISSWMGRDQCNDFSIGIELEGTDDSEYADPQYRSLKRVLLGLFEEVPIVYH